MTCVLERERGPREREERELELGADGIPVATTLRLRALALPPGVELGRDHAITFAPRSAR